MVKNVISWVGFIMKIIYYDSSSTSVFMLKLPLKSFPLFFSFFFPSVTAVPSADASLKNPADNKSEESHATETAKVKHQLAESLRKVKNLSKESEELKRKLKMFEKVEEENNRLHKVVEETEVLRVCLASAQEEVGNLLEEKQRLLETLQELQEEMYKSDQKRRSWNDKR